MTNSGGPYVMVAVLCENVIVGQDNRVSVINVIEQITHGRRGPDVPDVMPPITAQFKFLIELVGGSAKGRHAIKIQPEDPSGLQLMATEHPVQFGVGTGHRLLGDLQLELAKEGLYWIDVILVRGRGENREEELMTRMPLNVSYQPELTTTGSAES